MGVFGGGAVFLGVRKTMTQWLALFSLGQFLEPSKIQDRQESRTGNHSQREGKAEGGKPHPPAPQRSPSTRPPTPYEPRWVRELQSRGEALL